MTRWLSNAMTTATPPRARVVFLLDVDNTLLDNDGVIADMRVALGREVGAEKEARYWSIFEQCRAEVGYADYLGALQRFRLEDPHDPNLLAISSMLLNYPFQERLLPGALDVVRHLAEWGTTVILTDGDVVFQPLKIERSGLAAAVDGRVLIYVHKEHELADVERRFPADHYVLVDDKVRILTAVKAVWGARVTTVFPKQGHYATDPSVAGYPAPDFTFDRIAGLLAQTPPPGADRARSKT
ncbi:MAG: HAD family hydrolase [Gemmatimonadales bacterium]